MKIMRVKQQDGTLVDIPIGIGATSSVVVTHNKDTSAHADIREQVNQLSSEIKNLKDELTGSYTNKLIEAVSLNDMSSILKGDDGSIGYLNGKRWSSSLSDYITRANHDVTGVMRCNAGDIIRLKNITMYIDPSLTHGVISLYTSDGTALTGASLTSELSSDLNAVKDASGNIVQFTIPPWNNLGEIGMFSITCQDINEYSIITINEEIVDNIDSKFATLENSVSELDARVDALENNTTSNSNEIPLYWQTALEVGAESINTALCTAGRNKSAFLFYTDAHWNYSSQMSPKLLKYLYEHTGITKTFYGGDIVNDESSDYDAMKYLWEWRNMLKGLPNHHSVVGNHDDGNATNNLFSEQYVYGYLLASEETPDVVRGDKGMYYYIDHSPEKTRYIFLDTAYQGMNSKQVEFLKEALINTAEGWHIVVVSHIWYQPDYNQDDVRPIPLAGLSTDASVVVSMIDNYNSRTGDYADCKGWVEFCVGGHIHRDYDNTTVTGIPIILVETDSQHTRGNYTYTKGTISESSVNGIIADYDNHKIYIVRIGRGESRTVEITNYKITYTNVLPLSLGVDGVSVYNNKGYSENTRWSQSGQNESTLEGTYITGWIPVSKNDVIRLANMTTQSSNFILLLSDSPGSTKGSNNYEGLISSSYYNAETDDEGNIIEFTIPSNTEYSYIRIQCGGITEASIITINEPIE